MSLLSNTYANIVLYAENSDNRFGWKDYKAADCKQYFSAVNYSALKVDCFVLEINFTFVYCVYPHVKTLIRKVLNVGIC